MLPSINKDTTTTTTTTKLAHTARAYPVSVWSQLRVLLLPLDGMLVHCRILVHIYTPGWREVLWKLNAQEHNIMTPASAPTQTTRSTVHVHEQTMIFIFSTNQKEEKIYQFFIHMGIYLCHEHCCFSQSVCRMSKIGWTMNEFIFM